ncbi:hypothetical protein P152DRAFT_430119 [Eremomyces bilateralis CBS 781.70]|uniref:Large ribosomal subunit protein mL43 n=1 Tax=Eremomyces bilateralis CBS 781.70 TaxID=1392243 RepID=A0A6G1GCP1_9PEZI|nr:uncharacterized protein P152DRAFT_430119 [Eremomyces bilateralis CBS 781.70]KAF1815804.1 hypothetical protein P152DRAFT_430119 [Eremomyces bilateralis CBS 781.70]
MGLQALSAMAKGQNGVGAFILQCKRIDFHYCDYWGSSKGMVSFLKHRLAHFAKEHPSIEINVSPKPNHHPVIKGTFINGRIRAICVKNLEPTQIYQKALILRNASGDKVKRWNKPVRSDNPSVRGIWSPFHGAKVSLLSGKGS